MTAGNELPLIVFWGPGLAGATTFAERLGWLSHCRWDTPGRVPGLPPTAWGRAGPAVVPWRGRQLNVDLGYRGALYFPPLSSQQWVAYDGDPWARVRGLRAHSLRHAAAVLFVADSQEGRVEANQESLEQLSDGLHFVRRDTSDVPVVFALNKRDRPARPRTSTQDLGRIMSVAELQALLTWPVCEYVETSAITGMGVEAAITRVVEAADSKGPV